jgi:hypothetical protein
MDVVQFHQLSARGIIMRIEVLKVSGMTCGGHVAKITRY